MINNYTTCPLGLECIEGIDSHGNDTNCPNSKDCVFWTSAWSIPFNYEIIDGIPVLTVKDYIEYCSLEDQFYWAYLAQANKLAWIEAGFIAAWNLPNLNEFPDISF